MTSCEPVEGCPSFFKVIRYPSSPHLNFPKAFVKRFSENIPENPTLKTIKGDRSWKMEIIKNGEDYCFAHGWDQVIQDVQLCAKDIVVFWLVDPFTFQVSFFDKDRCDKNPTFINTNDCDNDVVRDNFVNDGHNDDDLDDNVGDVDETHDDGEFMQDEKLCFQKVISKDKYLMHEDPTNITRHKFSVGWSMFREYHQLSEGDICFFKFNKKEGALNLTQELKSKKPQHHHVKVKTKFEAEVVKRKRGRPRLQKPGSG